MVVALLLAMVGEARAAGPIDALLRAYPDELAGFDGSNLIWRDGTRMPVSDGRPEESVEEMIRHGSILDQFRFSYPAGTPLLAPTRIPGASATAPSSTRCMATAGPGSTAETGPCRVAAAQLGAHGPVHFGQPGRPAVGGGITGTGRAAGDGQEIPVSGRRHL